MNKSLWYTRALPSLGLLAAFILTLFGLAVSPVRAAPVTVCPSGCDYAAVEDAVAAANPGDTVEIAAGTYAHDADLSILVDKDLTIRGAGVDQTFITVEAGREFGRIFTIESGAIVVIEDMTITGGQIVATVEVRGGAYDVGGPEKSAGGGSALAADYPTTLGSITRAVPDACDRTARASHIACGSSSVTMNATYPSAQATSFATGQANETSAEGLIWLLGRGAGIYNEGDLTLTRVVVDNNTITMDATSLVVAQDIADGGDTRVVLSASATADTTHELRALGAGIYNSGSLFINQSTISNNRVDVTSATETKAEADSRFANRSSDSQATVPETTATAEARFTTVAAGGVYNIGKMALRSSTISGNDVTIDLDLDVAATVFEDITRIDGSQSLASTETVAAAGILSAGKLSIDNSTVSGNQLGYTSDVADSNGLYAAAGVFSTQSANLRLSTVAENSFSYDNSSVSGTQASGIGSALVSPRVYSEIPPVLDESRNSVISNNSQPRIEDLVLDVIGSIIAINNTDASDCEVTDTTVTLTGTNFSSDGSCGIPAATVMLGPLQNNGGPTQTHALLPGSPAIDSNASTLCIPTRINVEDQRGLPRNVDIPGAGTNPADLCDAGAFELQAPSNACPVLDRAASAGPGQISVGPELTTMIGTGMGSPTRSRMVAKVVVPNVGDLTDLYGQMAAKEYTAIKFVRFIYPDKDYIQVDPETDLGQKAAVSWWGADLDQSELTTKPFVKGRWFLNKGMRKMKAPRSFVLYATHTMPDTYANAWATFNSPNNFVAHTSGFAHTTTNSLAIPETQAATDIVIQVAVTDVNRGPETIEVTVRAGGVEETVVLTGPINKKSELLNLFEVTLPNVPAGVDEVEIVMSSALDTGDSAGLLGAAASYECAEIEQLPPVALPDYFLAEDYVATGGNLFDDNDNGADSLGTPAATLESFGGGSLGGTVTDNAAGATVVASGIGGGNLTVNADGSWTLTNPPFNADSFTFQYRIRNAAGYSDATVTVEIRPSCARGGDETDC